MPTTSPGTTTGITSLLVTGTLADPPDVRDTYTNLRLQVTQCQYRRPEPAGAPA